jgi:hypothetical protein
MYASFQQQKIDSRRDFLLILHACKHYLGEKFMKQKKSKKEFIL